MKDTEKIINEHYSKMSKKRHKVNPPSKDHFRLMQKKSVEARRKKKLENEKQSKEKNKKA